MEYRTIYQECVYEEVEKRSKFISYSFKVETDSEIQKKLNNIKEFHHSAKHHVYAYRLNDKFAERYSDDGEPSGTAGLPIMEVIKGFELKNILIVIVRYFGGILLGTGGLRRMYVSGAKNVIELSGTVKMSKCNQILVECEYKYYNQLNSIIFHFKGRIEKIDYESKIKILFYVPWHLTNQVIEKINNLLKTSQSTNLIGESYYNI